MRVRGMFLVGCFAVVVCVRFLFFAWAVLSPGGESHGSSTDGCTTDKRSCELGLTVATTMPATTIQEKKTNIRGAEHENVDMETRN